MLGVLVVLILAAIVAGAVKKSRDYSSGGDVGGSSVPGGSSNPSGNSIPSVKR